MQTEKENPVTLKDLTGDIIQEVKDLAILYNVEFYEALTVYKMAESLMRRFEKSQRKSW